MIQNQNERNKGNIKFRAEWILLTEQVKAEKKTKDGIFSHISKNK